MTGWPQPGIRRVSLSSGPGTDETPGSQRAKPGACRIPRATPQPPDLGL